MSLDFIDFLAVVYSTAESPHHVDEWEAVLQYWEFNKTPQKPTNPCDTGTHEEMN